MKFGFRKFGLSLLACAMLVQASVAFGASSADDFKDLSDLDAATKAKFDALISAGIFEGVGDGNFGLKDEMNRAQFAKVAALIFSLEVNSDLKTSSFSDVKADDPANGYALPYIEALKKAGITDGMGGGIFDPAGDVTKEQLATFMVRALGLEDKVDEKADDVKDPSISDWAKGYVALALEKKLLPGGGETDWNKPADRGLLVASSYEAAVMVEPPLGVDEAKLDGDKELTLQFTTAIDPKSIKLSGIKINGVALDDSLDSFELSEDGKTLIIKLRPGFHPGFSSSPTIEVEGIQSKFAQPIKAPETPVTLVVTNPPPVLIPYVPPVSSGPSVTSVTYSVYDDGHGGYPLIAIEYTPASEATLYMLAVPLAGIPDAPLTASKLKEISVNGRDPEDQFNPYASYELICEPSSLSSGDTVTPVLIPGSVHRVFIAIEVNGQLSGVHTIDVLRELQYG